jgi:predicted aldo/keto reductase-like oxidoreductase
MGLYAQHGGAAWNKTPQAVKDAIKSAVDYCEANSCNLIKLALHYSATQFDIDFTVVSMSSEELVRQNCTYLNKLSAHETKVLQEIREKYRDSYY